jgi:hypothetical protein
MAVIFYPLSVIPVAIATPYGPLLSLVTILKVLEEVNVLKDVVVFYL